MKQLLRRLRRAYLQVIKGLLVVGVIPSTIVVGRLIGTNPKTIAAPLAVLGGCVVLVKPLWALYASPVLDLWFYGMPVKGVPLRSYLIVLLLGTMALGSITRRSKQRRQTNGKVNTLVRLVVAFYGWMIFSTALASLVWQRHLGGGLVRLMIGRILVGLPLAVATLHFLDTKEKICRLLAMLLGGVGVSALVAILQFHNLEFAWRIRLLIAPPPVHLQGVETIQQYYYQVPGLAGYSIPFSYHIVNVLPLALGLLIGQFSREEGNVWVRAVFAIAVVIMGWALILSNARSALLGVGVGTIVMLLEFRRRRLREFSVGRRWTGLGAILMVLLLISILVTQLGDWRGYTRWNLDRFAKSSELFRIPIMLSGLLAGLEHPFGVGFAGLAEFSSRYYTLLQSLPGSEEILQTGPHNHFINMFAYFGIPGLIFIAAFYWKILTFTHSLAASAKDPLLRDISIGLMGTFTAALIHMQFHNAGPFNADLVHWYLIGILLSLLQMQGMSRAESQ